MIGCSQDAINALHEQGTAVVCYISAGTFENWRDDADKFPDAAVGNFLEGVDDECWLDINDHVRRLMKDTGRVLAIVGSAYTPFMCTVDAAPR